MFALTFEDVIALCRDEGGSMKEQAQQFYVVLEIILFSDTSDSEQSLPSGARAFRDHSDLAGSPLGTEDHMCKASGHCVSFDS